MIEKDTPEAFPRRWKTLARTGGRDRLTGLESCWMEQSSSAGEERGGALEAGRSDPPGRRLKEEDKGSSVSAGGTGRREARAPAYKSRFWARIRQNS